MNFHIATTARATGNLLSTLVREKLREDNIAEPDCHICYGVGYTGNRPSLNAACSRSKLQQAIMLKEGLGLDGLSVYPATAAGIVEAKACLDREECLLARNLIHSRGTDIKVVMEPWQVDALVASGSGFFTPYINSEREFRTWVYRKRHLGTYEKVLRRPQDYKKLGRNHANGFDFSGLDSDDVPEALKEVARKAVRVLGLDFGAVDVIYSTRANRYTVLEVNSAPGVSNERRTVIQALSKRVVRWIANGCPAREE